MRVPGAGLVIATSSYTDFIHTTPDGQGLDEERETCLQKDMAPTYSILAFGELLWDLLPDGAVLGGAPGNFAFRVNNLGHHGILISRVGNDDWGNQAFALLRERDIELGYIQRDPVHPTGTVNVCWDENQQPSYTINPGVAYDHIEYSQALADRVARAQCLCFGTLIQRGATSRETLGKLLAIAGEAGVPCLLDINLRRDCYSAGNVKESLRRADLLKLNDEEVLELPHLAGVPAGDLVSIARAVMRQYEIELCLITLGKAGALVVTPAEILYDAGYDSPFVDPVGCGDALTAGFICSHLSGAPLGASLKHANVLGNLVAGQRGPTEPVSPGALEAFVQAGHARVSREEFRQYQVS